MLPSIHVKCPIPNQLIQHTDKIMLMGSCFTEHIGKRFHEGKFQTLENPHGILFNPLSIAHSITSYINNETITAASLFQLNEIWNNWDFHTDLSDFNKEVTLSKMNQTIQAGSQFLAQADWLIITLGSSFQYYLKEEDKGVANCHRAPGQLFEKRLLTIDTITNTLQSVIIALKEYNPNLKIVFTISPVRHVRDGVVENNRSKARLIEVVHNLTASFDHCFYFPSYEIVIDELRDYRFYDTDLVHPNFAATRYVWECFFDTYFDKQTQKTINEMQELMTAFNHKIRFSETQANAKFKASFREKIQHYETAYPYIDFSKEKSHFQ